MMKNYNIQQYWQHHQLISLHFMIKHVVNMDIIVNQMLLVKKYLLKIVKNGMLQIIIV